MAALPWSPRGAVVGAAPARGVGDMQDRVSDRPAVPVWGTPPAPRTAAEQDPFPRPVGPPGRVEGKAADGGTLRDRVLILLACAAFVAVMVTTSARMSARTDRVLATGPTVDATVVAVHRWSGEPDLELRYEYGGATYTVTRGSRLDDPDVHAGDAYLVSVDGRDPSWAVSPWLDPRPAWATDLLMIGWLAATGCALVLLVGLGVLLVELFGRVRGSRARRVTV